MSTGSQKRKRNGRVASVELPPGVWGNLWGYLRRGQVLFRLALCFVTALVLWGITRGWAPPQSFRTGTTPIRDIASRLQFEQLDELATHEARRQSRQLAIAIYDQDPAPLVQLRAELLNAVSNLRNANESSDVAELWKPFELPRSELTPEMTEEERQKQRLGFLNALADDKAFELFQTALDEAFEPIDEKGLLDVVPPEHNANLQRIAVRQVGADGFESLVPMADVRIEDVTDQLRKALQQLLPLTVAQHALAYLQPRLPSTLKINLDATRDVQDREAENVKDQMIVYERGHPLALAGQSLDDAALELLDLEYQADLAARPFSRKVGYSMAVFGMYLALYTLCGFYVYFQEPKILQDLYRFVVLLVLVVITVGAMLIFPGEWRAEVAPLLLFGMTITIAYQQEMALLFSAALTLVGVVALGYGLPGAMVLMASTTGAILVLRQVRSRSKLLTVGLVAAIVAFLTTIGVGMLAGQDLLPLLQVGLLYAVWSIIAGSMMTCLLPAVERIFGVQTDLSLMELGDPAHPLLQELIRRAPGTYNHSITVASLAEAAAEAIGARGLLVRVGAYFHDIGKMLKPAYFVENQGREDNRHQSLVPAMSTLVIIAHVKDGADLARQNKLPQQIIEFIQQHHGTTLVEYFYRQASQQRSEEAEGNELDESTFRYPGPKPQTKEAGVLMLADAVESASRGLVEPTPARIESLVDEICRKRLLDGQFDECGLTLEEVRTIGDSLVKSLTAVYHGRVKYPDQETA